jgi:hypothetical protein
MQNDADRIAKVRRLITSLIGEANSAEAKMVSLFGQGPRAEYYNGMITAYTDAVKRLQIIFEASTEHTLKELFERLEQQDDKLSEVMERVRFCQQSLDDHLRGR